MNTYRIYFYQTTNFTQDFEAESKEAAIALFANDDWVPDESDGMCDGYEIADITEVK